MLGIHVNHKKIPEAIKLGYKSLQIFIAGPQSYRLIKISDEEIDYLSNLSRQGIRIYVHSSYVTYIWKDSKLAMAQIGKEIDIAEKIGAKGYVLHLPKWENVSIDSDLFNDIMSRLSKLVLLETPANTYNTEEIMKKLVSLCKRYDLKICVDTAHLWSSNIDVSTYSKFKTWFDKYSNIVGLVHFNDSLVNLGSRIDRHAIVGKGKIWECTHEYEKIIEYIQTLGIDVIYETHSII
jgi:endonuclease IV